MIKHKDWKVIKDGVVFVGVHDAYQAEHDSAGTWTGSHPVICGDTEQDCIEQIDDWYLEQE